MTRKYEINGTRNFFRLLDAYLTYKTEDGVILIKGSVAYTIGEGSSAIPKIEKGRYNGDSRFAKYFSTREAAQAYLDSRSHILVENGYKIYKGSTYYVYYSLPTASYQYSSLNDRTPSPIICHSVVKQSAYDKLRQKGVRWFGTEKELLDYRALMNKTNNESKTSKLPSPGSVLYKSTDNYAVYPDSKIYFVLKNPTNFSIINNRAVSSLQLNNTIYNVYYHRHNAVKYLASKGFTEPKVETPAPAVLPKKSTKNPWTILEFKVIQHYGARLNQIVELKPSGLYDYRERPSEEITLKLMLDEGVKLNKYLCINKVRNNNTGIAYTIGDTIDITSGKSEILSFEVLPDNNIKVYVKSREYGGYNNSVFLKNIDNVQ